MGGLEELEGRGAGRGGGGVDGGEEGGARSIVEPLLESEMVLSNRRTTSLTDVVGAEEWREAIVEDQVEMVGGEVEGNVVAGEKEDALF